MKTSIALGRKSAAGAEKALRDDHRRLEQLAHLLGRAKTVPALLAAAEELRLALMSHFALEEHPGGLYDSLKFCVPQHRAELAGLVEDHHHLMVAVWLLCQRARATRVHFPGLRKEAGQLLKKLHQHERREHRMARQAQGKAPGRKKAG